jgi:hypothetical protein
MFCLAILSRTSIPIEMGFVSRLLKDFTTHETDVNWMKFVLR